VAILTTTATERQNLWLFRLYYFCWIGGASFVFPFLNLFFSRRGLSGLEIGWLGTFGAVLGMLTAPMWGRWSDQRADSRWLLQLSLAGVAVTGLVLSQQTAFAWMAIVISAQSLLGAGQEPLSSALVLRVTQAAQSGYGSVRVWGSLAWALFVLVSGWLIEQTDSLLMPFVGQAALLGLCVLLIGRLTPPAPVEAPAGEASGPRATLGTTFRAVLRDRALVGLAIALGLFWMTDSGARNFEAIFMDQLGSSELLIGFANTAGAVVELPAMFWADRLVKHHGSHRVLKASLLINAATMGLILAAPSPWTIVLARAVGGLYYSLYIVALPVFIQERAPANQTATALALFGVTLVNLIHMISGPLSGAAFDAFGAYWLYALALVGALVAWVVLRLTVTGRRTRLVGESA
jgi:PPP family 3-phenylpropionic acid transporter